MKNFSKLRAFIADVICPEHADRRNQLERQTEIDELTGFGNRRAFQKATHSEPIPGVKIIVFDANNFGQVNKILGHETGDQFLIKIAVAIETAARIGGNSNRCFRFGGDEFAVLATEETADAIRDKAEFLFGQNFIAPGVIVSISGTVGNTFAEADQILQKRKKEQKK